jgi:hypothetical protein
VPRAPAQVDASHGNVSAVEQQPVHALAQPAEKALAQNHDGFFSVLNAEHHRYAIRCLHAATPASKPLRELAVPELAGVNKLVYIR